MATAYDTSRIILPQGAGYKASTLYAWNPQQKQTVDFSVVRATTATRVNPSGLIESVSANVPRIDYLNGGCGELLVEPQRTNLVTYSEQFDNAVWNKSTGGTGLTPVVTANAGVSPDGNTTADQIFLDLNGGTASNDSSSINDSYVVSSGATVTLSVYIKSNDANTYDLSLYEASSLTATSIQAGSTWQRVTLTATVPATSASFVVGLRNAFGVSTDDTADVLLWGAQLEEGSYATSYIPTVASTVTRNADVISLTGASSLLGDSAGGLFFEASWFEDGRISLSDGTTNNRVSIYISGAGLTALKSVGGSVTGTGTLASPNYDQFYKCAFRYAQNDDAFYVNGTQIGVNTSSATFAPSTLNSLSFTTGNLTDAPLYGRIRQLVVFDQALTNAELAAITS